jgi:hypothetical protein
MPKTVPDIVFYSLKMTSKALLLMAISPITANKKLSRSLV